MQGVPSARGRGLVGLDLGCSTILRCCSAISAKCYTLYVVKVDSQLGKNDPLNDIVLVRVSSMFSIDNFLNANTPFISVGMCTAVKLTC